MTRSTLLPLGLVALVALSGCGVIGSAQDRYPTPRRGDRGTVYRPADKRADRYDVRRSNEWRRVDRDAQRYVRSLDRDLRLGDRQARQIRQILENRTFKLLRESRSRDTRSIYPFPRRMRSDRYANRTVERFWRDADSRIERVLDRQQTREYRYLTGRSRERAARGRDNKRGNNRRAGKSRDRREDRRADRRRDDDRREDRRRDRDRD